MPSKIVYSVYPRYTPGSPAQVDEATASKIAREEREEYEWVKAHPDHPDFVKTHRGLGRIVIATWEAGSKLYTRDLLTGQIFFRRLRTRLDPRSGASFHQPEKKNDGV